VRGGAYMAVGTLDDEVVCSVESGNVFQSLTQQTKGPTETHDWIGASVMTTASSDCFHDSFAFSKGRLLIS